MKVHIKGEGDVTLNKTRDFVAEGGEGKVFVKSGVGYKIFHDPSKAIPAGKIQELSGISHPDVIRPEKLVYATKGRKSIHVGHTFRFVQDTWTLCQLFPRAFREREGFDHTMALDLVRSIQERVQAVHKASVLLVDLNEMNFLVSHDFSTPYFIDVDSYQTKHFPATAIMPSVRDWHTPLGKFNENSDWFSFAIVSFQLFVGIHPFKGKHPNVRGLEDRMKQQLSVFGKDVKVPKVCYPFDVIPPVYRSWYEAVFSGKRVAPPSGLQATIVVTPTIRAIQGTDNFEITELEEFADAIRAVYVHESRRVVQAGDAIWVDGHKKGSQKDPLLVAFTDRNNHPVSFSKTDKTVTDLISGERRDWPLAVGECAAHDGRLYFRSRDKAYEGEFMESGNKVVPGTGLMVNVMERASALFSGCVVMSMLGDPWVVLFPDRGTNHQVPMPELKGHKVLQAKYDNRVLMVLAAEGGTYHRFVFRFNPENFNDYDVRKVEDVAATDLNFITLESGICVCLNEEEQIEIFQNQKGRKSVKVIDDPILGGDMRLVKDGTRVLFYRGNKLYSLKMK
jgi:hypothetical protein